MPEWTSYSFLIGVLLKSAAVLAVAGLMALLLRLKSAAVRHLVWTAAFIALLTLPFLSITLPAVGVPVNGSLLLTGLAFETNSPASPQEAARQNGPQATTTSSLKSEPWLPDWRMSLMLVWAAGAALSFAQMFVGWAALQHLRRTAKPFTAPDEVVSLAKHLQLNRRVTVLEAPRGSMPITYGLFRPAVLVPADLSEWRAERRRIVLLHELAHVRRSDAATHLLARTALSLYWWNPLAWIAWREFLKERERAADDLVLAAGVGASEYATHLLEIARSMQSSATFGWAAVAMARRSQLEGRLLAILDSNRNRKNPRLLSFLLASFLAIALVAPLAAVQPKSDKGADRMPAQPSDQASVNSPAGLIKSGDLERERGAFDQAKTLYGKAFAEASSGPEAATALIHLGTVELATKHVEQAISDFERAQAADSGKTSEARMWMAIAQQHQNNLEAADAFYQSALAAEDPNSAAGAIIMELYAPLLRQQGRLDEAKTLQNRASDIRKAQGDQLISKGQPSGSDVYRVGGAVTPPVLLSKVEPLYTQEARIAKYQGTALLSVEINADGSVQNAKVLRALGFGLDEKAVEAISQWKFKPGVKDGQPVTVQANIEVNFMLL